MHALRLYQSKFVGNVVQWSSILSAPLALLPLGAIGVSAALFVWPKHASVAVKLVDCSADEMRVAFINTGNRRGYVAERTFRRKTTGNDDDTKYVVRPADSPLITIVPNSAPSIVSFSPYVGSLRVPFFPKTLDGPKCELYLTSRWTDFAGSEGIETVTCPCQDKL